MSVLVSLQKQPWTAADREALERFLSGVSGQRAIHRVLFNRPEHKSNSSIEERAVESAKMEGYEKAVSELLALQTVSDNA